MVKFIAVALVHIHVYTFTKICNSLIAISDADGVISVITEAKRFLQCPEREVYNRFMQVGCLAGNDLLNLFLLLYF